MISPAYCMYSYVYCACTAPEPPDMYAARWPMRRATYHHGPVAGARADVHVPTWTSSGAAHAVVLYITRWCGVARDPTVIMD